MRYSDLFEVRGAFLYHGTSAYNAEKIISQNKIEAKTTQQTVFAPFFSRKNAGGPIQGVSLARTLRVAFSFGTVVFAINRQKLATNYRIEPFDFWGHSFDPILGRRRGQYAEEEEFVPRTINNLTRYLEAIHISKSSYENIMRDGHQEHYRLLLNHPLIIIPKDVTDTNR